jgi:hypothetical protein
MEMSETGDQAGKKPARHRARKKAQTPARAFGRLLSDFEPLKPAERKLLEATARGAVAEIGDKRPEEATKENTVRAEFLRFLLLGGDERAPAHERGPRLQGAWIDGRLDLENAITASSVDCRRCTFTQPLSLQRSTLNGCLFLMGSCTPGINGDGLLVKGTVLLRDQFKATGTIRFPSSRIQGDLDFTDANLYSENEDALNADRIVIEGSIFLSRGFKAKGTLCLSNSQIGGNFECVEALIEGNTENIKESKKSIGKKLIQANKIHPTHASEYNQTDIIKAKKTETPHDFEWTQDEGDKETASELTFVTKTYHPPAPLSSAMKMIREIPKALQ